MVSGDVEGVHIADHQEFLGVRPSGPTSGGTAVQGPGGEVVQVGADVAEAARGDHGAEQVLRPY
jgi:hypothetical protein